MLKKYPTEIDFQLKTINLNNDRSLDIYANSLFVMRICRIRAERTTIVDDDFPSIDHGEFEILGPWLEPDKIFTAGLLW